MIRQLAIYSNVGWIVFFVMMTALGEGSMEPEGVAALIIVFASLALNIYALKTIGGKDLYGVKRERKRLEEELRIQQLRGELSGRGDAA